MPKLAWLLVIAGCGGTDPTASGIFPAEGFAGRSLRVEISGDATAWTSGAVVNFGAGVTVTNVAVASPTALFADISIDSTAATGLQDVTVESGGHYLLKQAFEVVSPVEVSFIGPIEQGGRPRFAIENRDFAHPFDLQREENSDQLVALAITPPAGTKFEVDTGASTAFLLTGFAELDGDSTGGAVTVTSGAAPSKVTSVSAAISIAPRAATALAPGQTVMGRIDESGQTLWYTLPAIAGLVHLTGTVSGNGAPAVQILEGGKWSQPLGARAAVVPTAQDVNIVVFDSGTASNYGVSVHAQSEPLASADEPTSDDSTPGTAVVPAAIPFQLTSAMIDSGSDADYVQVVIDPAHATQHLHVIAKSADDRTDTQVDITNAAGATQVGGPIDGGSRAGADGGFTCEFFLTCGEDYVAPILPSGTYYVKVDQGATNYDDQFASYTLLVYFD